MNEATEIIEKILNFKKGESDFLFFRGEPKDYGESKLTPSIFRNKNIENEDTFFKESQRYNNNDFAGDRTAFDKLSRLQHYDIPTRLLDISSNALIGLYFACENEFDSDGYLYLFKFNPGSIKYFDSDTIDVVSNLAKLPLINESSPEKSKKQIFQDALYFRGVQEFSIEKFNAEKSTKFLAHEIRADKPYFKDEINPEHLFEVLPVFPKLRSSRIIAQQGAFLCFGMNDNDELTGYKSAKKIVDSHDHLLRNKHIKKFESIKINCCKKKEILNSLDILGINSGSVYPDLLSKNKWISQRYQK